MLFFLRHCVPSCTILPRRVSPLCPAVAVVGCRGACSVCPPSPPLSLLASLPRYRVSPPWRSLVAFPHHPGPLLSARGRRRRWGSSGGSAPPNLILSSPLPHRVAATWHEPPRAHIEVILGSTWLPPPLLGQCGSRRRWILQQDDTAVCSHPEFRTANRRQLDYCTNTLCTQKYTWKW